jgi:glycosyltransferase involved in cell wall biosynthesis
MKQQLPGTIAVDLTPVLPGGENGGAKIFALELLRELAELAPQTRFILLTQHASHEELASLERPNMQRRMVLGASPVQSLRPRLARLAARVLPHLPGRARRLLSRIGYRLNAFLKRGGGSGLLRELGADLLFCPFTAPVYAEPGIPVVCTIHDLQFKTYPEFFSPEDVAHRERSFMDAARRATMLAAVSEYSRQSAMLHGKLEADRIRAIHLRLAQRALAAGPDPAAALARFGLAEGRYLIYPANFWKHKNHEMLLTAFGIACSSGLAQEIKLVCTGAPGPRQQWLQSAAQAMGLEARVVFPGFLPTADFAALMLNAAGVIFPSLYEGFGLPVIEAMAAGKPVACSNGTSLPEVAADAVLMFDARIPEQIAQAMISLTADAALRERLAQAGRARAAEFADTRRMASEYLALFQEAMGKLRYEDFLGGVHEDGWAGTMLQLQVGPHSAAQTVEIELEAASSLPARKLTIKAKSRGSLAAQPFPIARGATATWSLPVGPEGGLYEITLLPGFVPQHLGHAQDARTLSARVLKCSILRPGGVSHDLLRAKQTA